MNSVVRELAREGRFLWLEYVRINGYSFSPSENGLKALARSLDLSVPWIQKRINAYLEA